MPYNPADYKQIHVDISMSVLKGADTEALGEFVYELLHEVCSALPDDTLPDLFSIDGYDAREDPR